MALELMEGIEDSYEPDGAPNPQNRFLGSYRSNLHYYLGQTQWATGDFSSMIEQMEISASGPLVQHPDRWVATTYWRYLGLRKLGRDAEAATLVSQIPLDLELLENHPSEAEILRLDPTLGEGGSQG